jgi:hemolysin activation/secretion protein
MGLSTSLQFARALVGLGSSQYASLYGGSVSKGFTPSADGTLLSAASFSGEYAEGRSDRQVLSSSARYYLQQDRRAVFFTSLTGDRTRYANATQLLSLGGDNGLRGYPAKHQSGDRRVVFTTEERFYTDWYPLRLLRIGGAVFFDIGRAWSGPLQDTSARWLSDVGFGLRALSARSSGGTTFHADFAFPLTREAGIRSFQFSFMSKTGF